jgi:hypothetical protein
MSAIKALTIDLISAFPDLISSLISFRFTSVLAYIMASISWLVFISASILSWLAFLSSQSVFISASRHASIFFIRSSSIMWGYNYTMQSSVQ